MAKLLNQLPTPITLTKDRDYMGRDYWTVSADAGGGQVMEEHADTRTEAIKMAAPMLAAALGIAGYYITEQEYE